LDRATNLLMGFDTIIQTDTAIPPINPATDTHAPGNGPWFHRVRLGWCEM